MSTNGRSSSKPTIVLVHGLWLTPRSWEGWIDRFQKAGYNVLAPSWPGLEGEVEAVRKNPSALKGLKLKTVVDHYDRIIRKLDAQPIIIGHSFGGLITQMLIDRGLGSAGILLDSRRLSYPRESIQLQPGYFTQPEAVQLRLHERARRR